MPKNSENVTTHFKVDISDLKRAMQDARKQVALANSEFKATSSGMDQWSKSTDGISGKLKQLNANLVSQKAVLSEYETVLEKVKKEYGENSKEALDYEIKLNNQTASVNRLEKEIAYYSDRLKTAKEAEEIAAKTGKDAADVFDDLAQAAKKTGDEVEDAGGGFTVLKGAIAGLAGNLLTGLVDSFKNGIQSIIGLASETREYRSELAKLDAAFTTAGFTTEAAKQTYQDLYAVLGDEGQSVEAVNHLAKLCNSEKELADWTTIATGVYATFGDSLPVEGLTEAANETAKVGKVTGPLADALNWAGVSEDEFNKSLEKCSNEQERQQLITETLNGLYTDAAKRYEETNQSVMDANRAQSDYTDTMAAMGEKIEPVVTTVKKGFTELLQELLKLVQDVDMEAFTKKIEDGFSVLKDKVFPAVKNGLQWIIDNKGLVIGGLIGIAGAFAGMKIVGFINNLQAMISVIKGWELVTKLQTAAQWLLNAAMNANPIGLVVALIAALVAAFVVLWNKSEAFRNFWIGLWEAIKSICAQVIESVCQFFTETIPNALNTMSEFFKNLPTIIATWLAHALLKVAEWCSSLAAKGREAASNFINNIVELLRGLPGKILGFLLDIASKIVSWGSNLATKGREAAQKLLTAVVDTITELPKKMLTIGSDIVSGLWNGITEKVQWLKNKISDFVGDVTGWLKKFFKIGSPSRLMRDEVGRWLPEGIAVGISDNAKSVLSAMRGLTVDTLGSARDTLNVTPSSANAVSAGAVVHNFTQIIHSPKPLNRLELYRQSKNLLGYAQGGN